MTTKAVPSLPHSKGCADLIYALASMRRSVTTARKTMKKNILTPLQIAWLVLAMFTAHNSILALTADAEFCANALCLSEGDCAAPCRCDMATFVCIGSAQSGR